MLLPGGLLRYGPLCFAMRRIATQTTLMFQKGGALDAEYTPHHGSWSSAYAPVMYAVQTGEERGVSERIINN